MNTIPAINVLDGCGKTLRKVAGEALAGGDYDSARQIMAWAENVDAMAATARRLGVRRVAGGAPAMSALLRGAPGKPRPVEDEYPRFLRRGDELVKVGWSKREKKEYHHRAPRRALDALVAAIRPLAAKEEPFTSEEINPLKDPDGGVFPTYQVFVALAWLKALKLITQLGRKNGYTLNRELPLDQTIGEAWLELTAWRG